MIAEGAGGWNRDEILLFVVREVHSSVEKNSPELLGQLVDSVVARYFTMRNAITLLPHERNDIKEFCVSIVMPRDEEKGDPQLR